MTTDIHNRIARIRASVSLPDLLLSYGVDLKKRGDSYTALCPWHDDHKPSFSAYTDSGVERCYCHGCGRGGDIVDAYMEFTGATKMQAVEALEGREPRINGKKRGTKMQEPELVPATWKAVTPPRDSRPDSLWLNSHGDPVASWEYKDAEGITIGIIARYEDANGDKTYRPWTYGSMSNNVSPKWEAKIWHAPRPMYGLDRLAAKPDAKVMIVEGEKAADAAQQLLSGMACITWPGGAQAISKINWKPLAGRRIVLVPDADIPGESAMIAVAGYLLALGCEVEFVDSSAQPKGWDIADAMAEGWNTKQLVEWARSHKKIVTAAEIEAKKIEAERVRMSEKKTATDTSPAISLVSPSDSQPATIENTEAVPTGNVIPIRAVQIVEDMPPEFTEFHLAKIFVEEYGHEWRYTPEWDTWFRWDGQRWKPERGGGHTRAAQGHLTKSANLGKGLSPSQVRSICSMKQIKSMLAVASASDRLEVMAEAWDADPMLLGTPSGIVDLRTGKLRPVAPEDSISKITAVAPQRGPHPVWDMVLDRCTMGDPDMREYYQRWAGYMLTGDCREEGFLFVHGAGGSGKSKFIDCLGDMMGDYCTTAKVEMLMESKIERHTEEIAALAGARMVRTSEPEEGSRWNEALLKLLTGRDKVSARRLYEKQFEFRPQFKLVMSGNFRPALKSTGEEIRRRMHFVEFPDSIPEHERIGDLPERLQAEWPAILQWAVDGCIEWQHRGLGRPDAVHEATSEYLSDEDTLGAWIAESCIMDMHARELTGDMYAAYRKAIEASGEFPVSQKRFAQRMESRGFGRSKSGSQRYITGIRLAKPTDPHYR